MSGGSKIRNPVAPVTWIDHESIVRLRSNPLPMGTKAAFPISNGESTIDSITAAG